MNNYLWGVVLMPDPWRDLDAAVSELRRAIVSARWSLFIWLFLAWLAMAAFAALVFLVR